MLERRYILIIGAMKSGTTTLFDLLALHPLICPAKNKEPGFFAFEDRWAEGLSWYDSLYDFDQTKHKFRMDASTDYSKQPFSGNVVERLKSIPDANFKIIYIIRNPLRRIESHAKHVQMSQRELGQRTSPRQDHSLDHGISPVNLATSRYALQLEPYKDFFLAGDLLILNFEDMTSNHHQTITSVCQFLGIPDHCPPARHSNSASEKKGLSQTLTLIRSLAHQIGLTRLLPPQFKKAVVTSLQRPAKTPGRFILTTEEELRLMKEFEVDASTLARDYLHSVDWFTNSR